MTTEPWLPLVTRALLQRIDWAVRPGHPEVSLTTARPGRDETDNAPRVIVFLLKAVPPNTGQGGRALGVDLQYVVSFYGDAGPVDLHAQGLLQDVWSAFDDDPILHWADVPDATRPAAIQGQVAIRPAPDILDDLIAHWATTFGAPYVLSLVYTVSVQLAGPTLRTAGKHLSAPPHPALQPDIQAAYSESLQGSGVALYGDTVYVQGRNFDPATAEILVGGAVLKPEAGGTPKLLTVKLLGPDVSTGNLLLALRQGDITSTDIPFSIRPVLRSAEAKPAKPAAEGAQAAYLVTVRMSPAPKPGETCALLLNSETAGSESGRFALERPAQDVDVAANTATVTFSVTDLPAGPYLARVVLNEVDSMLDWHDTSFTGPIVTLPEA
ncbi:MAG: Pvc16 family protein [Pseudomonadota bacterium]